MRNKIIMPIIFQYFRLPFNYFVFFQVAVEVSMDILESLISLNGTGKKCTVPGQ